MKRLLIKWHRILTWVAFVGVLCWALSGVSHPIMAWFGPQAKTMMPPTFKADASVLLKLEQVVDKLAVDEAAIVKVVATGDGHLLQVTEDEHSARRYFSLETGAELPGYDIKQARWLAGHYLDVDPTAVIDIKFRDSFGAGYPRVNRLLPVYEVSIATDDDLLTAFIYTETGVLAALNNNFKAKAQRFFRLLHTWSWLDATGFGRVLVVMLFMLTLLAMAVSGLYLVFALPSRKIPNTSRRWHRRFAYVLWLPLLAWSASGFYHLLQAQYVQPVSGMRLLEPVQLKQFAVSETAKANWQQSLKNSIPTNAFLHAITLNQSINQTPLYRLGVAQPIERPLTEHEQRKARFAGQALEKNAVYIDAYTGNIADANDKQIAHVLAEAFNGTAAPIKTMNLVTHFGPGYDFRNKRLPVWQVDFDDNAGNRYFIDPVTGTLVDRNRSIDRLESLSFSVLHKWNILRPLIGPEKRDILIVITLLALIIISCFGLAMYLSHKRQLAAKHTKG